MKRRWFSARVAALGGAATLLLAGTAVVASTPAEAATCSGTSVTSSLSLSGSWSRSTSWTAISYENVVTTTAPETQASGTLGSQEVDFTTCRPWGSSTWSVMQYSVPHAYNQGDLTVTVSNNTTTLTPKSGDTGFGMFVSVASSSTISLELVKCAKTAQSLGWWGLVKGLLMIPLKSNVLSIGEQVLGYYLPSSSPKYYCFDLQGSPMNVPYSISSDGHVYFTSPMDHYSGFADNTVEEVCASYRYCSETWSDTANVIDGPGPIRSGLSSTLCIDDAHGYTTPGTPIRIWDCNGTGAQNWTVNYMNGTLQVLGGCLDVMHGSTAIGTNVQYYTCNGTPAQQWRTGSNGSFINVKSGLCLDDPKASLTPGTQLRIWTCNGTPAQRWELS